RVAEHPAGRAGVRTRLGMQVLLGLGLCGATRGEILRHAWLAASGRGPYADSREELTPVALDGPSLLPLAGAAAVLLASPALAGPLVRRGWGSHLLTPEAMRRIRSWPPADGAVPARARRMPRSARLALRS